MADGPSVNDLQDFKNKNTDEKLDMIFIKLSRYETLFNDIKFLQGNVESLQENMKLLDSNLNGLGEQFESMVQIIDGHDRKIVSNKTSLDTLLKRDTE